MDKRSFEHLCTLARMNLDQDEIEEFERKFERLLGFVDHVQAYEPKSEGPPMTLVEKVQLRRDTTEPFDWPESTVHEYHVPKIIDFEGGG